MSVQCINFSSFILQECIQPPQELQESSVSEKLLPVENTKGNLDSYFCH